MKSLVADIGSILRVHIILVAVMAALVMSWLLTAELALGVALLGGVDWLLINLLNKLTDLEEDEANGIRGTGLVARHSRRFAVAWVAIFVGSFAVSLLAYPGLTWLRVLVQVIGLGYSLRLVPTFSGMKRFKDLYFLKNFMSAALFVLTVFVYPVASAGYSLTAHGGAWAWWALVFFFIPFELSYEILYDLRDLEGDALAGVPTYPVVHGPRRARQIIDGLLIGSTLVVVIAFFGGLFGVRELLFAAAPALQFVFYRPRFRKGLTSADCILLTHLGSLLLGVYLLGNHVWLWVGLPENIYF